MSETPTADTLSCIEEWCDPDERDDSGHGPVCPDRLMDPMTKAQYVDHMEAAARIAVEAYRILLDEDDLSVEAKAEGAVDDVHEVAVCHAGIGSCGRGGCKHG